MARPQMLVCMERNNAELEVIPRAQALTTRMFDQIGVALVWRRLERCSEELRPIVILLSLDTPRELFPKALHLTPLRAFTFACSMTECAP